MRIGCHTHRPLGRPSKEATAPGGQKYCGQSEATLWSAENLVRQSNNEKGLIHGLELASIVGELVALRRDDHPVSPGTSMSNQARATLQTALLGDTHRRVTCWGVDNVA